MNNTTNQKTTSTQRPVVRHIIMQKHITLNKALGGKPKQIKMQQAQFQRINLTQIPPNYVTNQSAEMTFRAQVLEFSMESSSLKRTLLRQELPEASANSSTEPQSNLASQIRISMQTLLKYQQKLKQLASVLNSHCNSIADVTGSLAKRIEVLQKRYRQWQ